MNIIKFSIENPVTVIVAVLMVLLFGMLGLTSLPYQLSPTVTEPEISVETTWTGAASYEVERDIIEEQERVLKGMPGLIEMDSSSFNGRGAITLKFKIGTDVDNALLRVSNKLNEAKNYPETADKPVINASGSAASPVVWMVLKTKEGNSRSIYTYRTFFEDEIRQYIERVDGVADLLIRGGTEKEMQIIVDSDKLAAYGITISDLISLIGGENVNISAGNMGLGRRDYRIRTVAQFNSPADIEDIVVKSTGLETIRLKEIAKVDFGYKKITSAMIHNNENGVVVGVKPEADANILDLTERVSEVVNRLNDGKLKDQGIYLDWVYDQRPYINGAISLVKIDVLIGGVLAVIVLFAFLRRVSSTLVVSAAIPISIIGSFPFLLLMGRSLNVVSLAGMSFAVGIFIDNAIVVLENIDRHHTMGKSPRQSAIDGTTEVIGAVIASSLTNIAVFLPVVFIKEEAGQLFRDIAIAITASTVLSIFVSFSVIPMLACHLSGASVSGENSKKGILSAFGSWALKLMMLGVRIVTANKFTSISTIAALTALAVISTALLFPKMEYLPQGNRNLVLNILVPPPGLSFQERENIGKTINKELAPHINKDKDGFPGIKNLFYIGDDAFMLFGAVSTHEQRASELIPLFMKTISTLPGIFGISMQAGVFQTNLGRGRTINVDISGDDLNHIISASGALFGLIKQEMPEAQIRPVPSLEMLYPEVLFEPIRNKLRAVDMTSTDVGIALDVLMDGRQIGEFKEEGKKKIDLTLKASDSIINTPEELYNSLLITRSGKTVPVNSLTTLTHSTGITEIRHLERKRTVTLQVTPPFTIPLQQAMELIENNALTKLKAQGILTPDMDIHLSGAADKLTKTRQVMQWNFILALIITYLLMSALFGNFIYPFIIMFSVPLAASGGFIGLKLANMFLGSQPLDILTMLGFIILVGVVVNNPILIVYQAIYNVRQYGMDHKEAVLDATKTRIRPIYMSVLVSIFGMLPLVLAPGPGSEFYKGLGSVMLGGLAISTVFTIFIIPAFLTFFIKMEKRKT
ncbi:hydrophobe/amphiphile efflux-1 (HAE1) family RND transporter [Candidatus Magnetoovum chiemensis]|nr:hydrophobe/amphiphile efflux-1 (HAE1) family RND transporter [Candidatus Magnetoovum chiemensis]